MEDAKDWVNEIFEDIGQWNPKEIDKERVVWVRCHGILVNAWNNEFFSALARIFGTFLGVDENTRKKTSMDVARILIRTKCYDVFNRIVHAQINDILFQIKVLEDWFGPMRWDGFTQGKVTKNSGDGSDCDSDSDYSDDGDGPPLFRTDYTAGERSDTYGEEEEGEPPLEGERTKIMEGIIVNVVDGTKSNDVIDCVAGIENVVGGMGKGEEVAHGKFELVEELNPIYTALDMAPTSKGGETEALKTQLIKELVVEDCESEVRGLEGQKTASLS